jgi:hypothetical protein
MDLGTLILARGMIFLIFRIFMSNLNGLRDFYHDSNVGINLPWLGNLAYSRTTVKIPKFLGAASKHYVASLEHLHPTPANTAFH